MLQSLFCAVLLLTAVTSVVGKYLLLVVIIALVVIVDLGIAQDTL